MKRLFDVVIGVVGSVVSLPLIVALVGLSTFDTRSWGLFTQVRVGRHSEPIKVRKIRSMRVTPGEQLTVTVADDARITRFGSWLRRSKLDELPQIWLVAQGKMSLVGPRPDVPGYADSLSGDEVCILELRPGVTGPAAVLFRDEERLLAEFADPVAANDEILWPAKVAVNKAYAARASLLDDLRIVLLTLKPDNEALVRLLCSWDPDLLEVEGVRLALGARELVAV